MRSKLREALIGVITELRPSWDSDGIRKALEHPDVASVNENALTLAAIRAATDGKVRSPGVIPSQGPHWDEKPANPPTLLPPPFVAPKVLTEDERHASLAAAARARQALAVARQSFTVGTAVGVSSAPGDKK